MTIFLVRQASAKKRSRWEGPDILRPLTTRGERQARGIRERLVGAPLQHVFSSPALRCRETVEGLASSHGMNVELDARLAEAAEVESALELVRELGERPAVLCASGDSVIALLRALGVGGSDDRTLHCEPGSVWALDREDGELQDARYLPPMERRGEKIANRRIAVLDLGSMSFSLLVADASATGEIEPVLRQRIMLRLGAVSAAEEGIPKKIAKRAVEAVEAMRDEAENVGSELMLPIATAALREASNGPKLEARLGKALGTPIRTISGIEEARLVCTAIRQRLDPGPESLLALDLGGGSLELAIDEAGRVEWETSLMLGVTRMHGEFVSHDPLSRSEVEAIRERTRSDLEPHVEAILERDPHESYATGGTVRALARLVVAQRGGQGVKKLRGTVITKRDMKRLAEQLAEADHSARLRMPAVQSRRADLLPTGALILDTVMQTLELGSMIISDWGIREGAILESFQER